MASPSLRSLGRIALPLLGLASAAVAVWVVYTTGWSNVAFVLAGLVVTLYALVWSYRTLHLTREDAETYGRIRQHVAKRKEQEYESEIQAGGRGRP